MQRVKIFFDKAPAQGWNYADIEEVPDAPKVRPGASTIPCEIKDCTKPASFIIHRRALCEDHRGS